jgi:DNA-binding NarL/FixJ family response regulator
MNHGETSDAPARVLVVDDHPLIRKALAQLFADRPEFILVGEASTCEEGRTLALQLKPDLLLLDLHYGKAAAGGIDALRAMRKDGIDAYIIVLTVSDDPNDLAAAIRAGADGYLLKDTDPGELMKSFRNVMEGQTVISPNLAGALASIMRKESGNEDRHIDLLTVREREILSLLVRGSSNKLIARELDIAEGTVKVHIKGLLRKLGFRSRLEAAVWAIEKGIDANPAGAALPRQR